MLRMTVVLGLSLLVFALSSVVPIQRFGMTLSALLGVELIGNLILLPALLAGPLGKYLCPHVPGSTLSQDDRACCDGDDARALEYGGAGPTGAMHNPPREGRSASAPRVRRDGSHT
jgi:hypothetical protein